MYTVRTGSRSARRWVFIAAVGVSACASDYTEVTARLDPADQALVAKTTHHALEDSPVGVASNWSNETTGHRGTVTPTRTFITDAGTPCRDYQQTATVEGRTIVAYDTACRGADGQWRSTHHGSLASAILEGDRPYAYGRHPAFYDDPFCRWPYRDPFCHPYYGYYGPSMRFGYGFGF